MKYEHFHRSQLKKYLEFINSEKSDGNQSNSMDVDVLKLISDEKCEPNFDLTQLPAKTEYNCGPFSNISEEILPSKEEDYALKELLRQEDLRKDTSKRSLKKRIKKLKNSSQNLFNKKIRSKRYDYSNDDELTDRSSLNSYSSDRSAKFSFSEIKNEFKRKSHFRSLLSKKTLNEGDGSGMAALLVRSVLHAHSSLDCIKESLESSSPSSTLRRSSKSQPKIEITSLKIVSPEISIDISPDVNPIEPESIENPMKLQFLSLDNISLNSDKLGGNLNPKMKKRTVESCPATPNDSSIVDPCLSIPSSQNIMGSSLCSSTICSSDEYSSSDIDDSDDVSDGNKNITTNAADTVSLVVRSVVGHKIDSNIISHMDEKLENISPKSTDKNYFEFGNDLWNSDTNSEYDLQKYINENDEIEKNNEIINRKLLIISNSNISQNISDSPNSYAKGIDPDLDLPPVMGGASIKSQSLVDTALQTMLLDKVNVIGCYSSPPTAGVSSPTSADPDKHKFKFHFPRHLFRRHKSEIDENSLKSKVFRKASKISLPSLVSPIRRKIRTFSDGDKKKEEPTLIKTAIQTILMEKVNIMGEIITHNPIVGDEEHIHPSENEEEQYGRHSHSFHPGDGEDGFDIHSDVLSCYSDDSKHNTLDVPYDTLSHDLLSLSMKETVLGSPFLSYNELRCFSHPNINLIDTPKFDTTRRFSDVHTENQMHSSDSKIEPKYADKYFSGKRGSIDSNLFQQKLKNSVIRRKISSVKETSQSVENLQSENQNDDPNESFLITNNLIENLKTDKYCEASKISEELSKEVSKESKLDVSDTGSVRPKVAHERSSYSKPDGNKHALFTMHRSLLTLPPFCASF